MAVTRRQREDFATTSSAPTSEPVTTFAVQIIGWKRESFERYFPERHFHFLPMNVGEREFERVWKPRILAEKDAEFLAWGPELPAAVEALAKARNIPVTLIEDGFLRSARPSASRTPPLSLTLDGRALYFDCRHASDLEVLLKTYDFEADTALMERARAGIALLTESGISSIMARVSARPRRFRREDAQAGPGRRPGGGPCFSPVRLSQPHDQQ